MYKVYRDRDGKNLLDEINFENKQSSTEAADNTDYSDDAYRKKIEMLNEEVIQLRDEIAQVQYLRSQWHWCLFLYSIGEKPGSS